MPKINQIVILNGGYGSRVRSISGNLPKCLIKIGGIPFLFHQLDLIKKAKIRNVVLCLGYKSQYVINFLKKNHYICNMKNTLIILFFISHISFSQKIDYNNFDSKHASKVLFDKLNAFRDTITKTGYGKDLEVAWPMLVNNHQLMKLTWSETLYDTVVLPNTLENVKQKKLFQSKERIPI